jgi:pyridoxine 5-phosphate synthase
MTKLSVNVNKFALLRNSRGGDLPNVLHMAKRCIRAGAHGITVHPRPDERHIRYRDAREIGEYIRTLPDIEFNIEGNPAPKFIELVKLIQPDQCTLVPDDPGQLTSDHGWNLERDGESLKPIISSLHADGIRVSLFMDPELRQVRLANDTGADRIELYTEAYARAFGSKSRDRLLDSYSRCAAVAIAEGLGVNAGHDLNLRNLGAFLGRVNGVAEVSIGHALVVESFDRGLEDTVRRYLHIVGFPE